MSNGLILAIDQGTTNTKALAFDPAGQIVATASVAMQVRYPQPGWAEQSALDIWSSVQTVIAQVVKATSADMDALAISNQRETIIVWDAATGSPIAPAITWQCRRSVEQCDSVRAAGHAADIETRTGLGLDPLFPAAKIRWILDTVSGARAAAEAGKLRAGTVDSWLLWNLTGGELATDVSNASRTQLFNINDLAWDPALADIFGVPMSLLPKVRPSDSNFGLVTAGKTALTNVPVHAMAGDSHAALYGHGIRSRGAVKATYGTGSSLMTLTDSRIESRHGLSSTIAWATRDGVAHALEGNISVSGQAAAYMAKLLGIPDAAALAELAASVPDSNEVSFVPALVGLGAPHWVPTARGLVGGLSLGTTRAHLARAAIEAIAHQVADVFAAMEADLGFQLAGLSADGGAAGNDMLMQFQADMLGRPVSRTARAEVSAIGAARLAAFGLGRNDLGDPAASQTFTPAMSQDRRKSLRGRWHDAVQRTLYQPDDSAHTGRNTGGLS